MTRSLPGTAKKLARYCCQECGAKELFLYCWKGCRHIQNLKTFYNETKANCHEIEALKDTIYAQERRLRDAERLLKESQQSLDVLVHHVKVVGRSINSSGITDHPNPINGKGQDSLDLPAWSEAAIGLVLERFDIDKDGLLNEEEFAAVEELLKEGNPPLRLVQKTENYTSIEGSSLLDFYRREGIARFTNDLRTLDIHFGTTPTQAASIMHTIHTLNAFGEQMNVGCLMAQDLNNEITALKEEVNEKARTTTRLREGFAEVQMALNGKDTEIQCVHQHRSHVNKELEETRTSMLSVMAEIKTVNDELTVKSSALHNLRALVEDQVHEKEKWQKYCWELEERLYNAVHTSHIKERDLWKARDAKKEATRKNMLLYMDRGMGKKHYGTSIANTPRVVTALIGEDTETDASWCSEGYMREVNHIAESEYPSGH